MTVRPLGSDCKTVIDPGYVGTCVLAAGVDGTVAAVSEHLEARGAGTGSLPSTTAGTDLDATPTSASHQTTTSGVTAASSSSLATSTTSTPGVATVYQRDLVYKEQAGKWHLILQRVTAEPAHATTKLYRSDVLGSHDPVAVFVVPAPKTHYGNQLDVVAGTGAVTLSYALGGGFATAPRTGEVDLYTPKPAGRAFARIALTHAPGATGWTVRSIAGQISASAARRLTAGGLWVEPKAAGGAHPTTTTVGTATTTLPPPTS